MLASKRGIGGGRSHVVSFTQNGMVIAVCCGMPCTSSETRRAVAAVHPCCNAGVLTSTLCAGRCVVAATVMLCSMFKKKHVYHPTLKLYSPWHSTFVACSHCFLPLLSSLSACIPSMVCAGPPLLACLV